MLESPVNPCGADKVAQAKEVTCEKQKLNKEFSVNLLLLILWLDGII
jgi:hypothetical protein